MGVKKPQEEFFAKILTTLDIANPSEVLYFDDSSENI
jgi:HAD superfamily hydrolase (TIGR01509 family)